MIKSILKNQYGFSFLTGYYQYEFLSIASTERTEIERAFRRREFSTSHLNWPGHVIRRSDERTPKSLVDKKLYDGSRKVGRVLLRNIVKIKHNINSIYTSAMYFAAVSSDRVMYRSMCLKCITTFERSRIEYLFITRQRTKHCCNIQAAFTKGDVSCSICWMFCGIIASKIHGSTYHWSKYISLTFLWF